MAELNEKQKRFVKEYLVDMNATQAAIRAGYSEKTAGSQGFDLLKNPEIDRLIKQTGSKRMEKLDLSADRVLNAIAEIAFGDIRKAFTDDGALLRPHEWDDETAAAIAGMDIVTVSAGEGMVEHVAKIKRTDRLRALDMLARHHALYNDKLEVTGLDGLADRLARAAKRGEEA